MRFMIIVKATADREAGVMPPASLLAQRGAFDEELACVGIAANSQHHVLDGPFAETQALIAGYTLIPVRSREGAVEWSRRHPNPTLHGGEAQARRDRGLLVDRFQVAP